MRFQPFIRGIFLAVTLAAGSGLVLAGCGSSGGSTSPSHTPSPAHSSSGSGGSAATAAITANWQAFFSAKTPVSRRVQLLQDGQMFQSLIAAQARSPLASSASAKVTKVSSVTSTKATVTYSIQAAGQTVLPNQTGVAVYQNGVWKVGLTSFCGLLRLEKAAPASCNSAG